MIVLQVALLVVAVTYFSQSAFYLYLVCHLISVAMVLVIVNNNDNPFFKITWIIAILGFPLAGGLFYIFFGNSRLPKKIKARVDGSVDEIAGHYPTADATEQTLDPHLLLQERYIRTVTGFPACSGTGAEYFALGEHMYDAMLRELHTATRYILLEYFIIRPGMMWDTIFAILKDKVRDGVRVYMMYDDLGSISTLPKRYDKMIRDAGIRLTVFNPIRPRGSPVLNYRDHRKILVIDGKVGFCGGINLADEYINQLERFGHWKDTGVLLRGKAVWGLTLLFLQQWQFNTGSDLNLSWFREETEDKPDGLVQVFGDSPLDGLNITETAYLNIISRATRYVYITTPYLVIDYEMEQALCAAARSGIDIRIITPYRYDKWFVHILTRSHYKRLIEAGVRIYEYTPGFIHSKMFVSDDKVCMVGTCNMDFRSFYLHFECSAAFYHSSVIAAVKRDITDCWKLCHEVSLDEASNIPLRVRFLRTLLKVFAPLM
jgi:cardiolipin synthase